MTSKGRLEFKRENPGNNGKHRMKYILNDIQIS